MDFVEKHQITAGFVPLDLQTQRDGDYVKAGDYLRTLIVFFKGTGTDGDDPIVTLQQASDNSGTGVKALGFTTIWTKQGADVLTVAQFTKVTAPSSGIHVWTANTYKNTDGHQQAIWVVEIHRDQMDIAGGFTYLRATLNDTGSNAQLGCVIYVPMYPIGLPASAL